MKKLTILMILLTSVLCVNIYAQPEWESIAGKISIKSNDGLNFSYSTDGCQLWNIKATTKAEKKANKISFQTGSMDVRSFHNDSKSTQRRKKLVIDIHDNNNNPSNYRYKVFNEKGHPEWVSGVIYWGISINFQGTDGHSYVAGAWYANVGSKEGLFTYRDPGTYVNFFGNTPTRGEFDEGWQQLYPYSGAMPDALTITYQTDGMCYVQYGTIAPTNVSIAKVSKITSIDFVLGSGASIALSNYSIMEETLYSKVKTYIEAGDSRVKNGDYIAAAEAFSKAIDKGYKNYDIYYRRASAYYSAQFYNNAIDDYTYALSYRKSEDAYLYRGMAKLQKNDMTGVDDLKKGGSKGQALVREFELDNIGSGTEVSADASYTASGSGIIVDPKGYIATNYHVIDGAKKIDAFMTRGGQPSTFSAAVVVADKTNDLAIIKINDPKYKSMSSVPYSLGTSTREVGTSVFAMGYPELSYLGEELKVTDGIISSKTGYQGDITTYQISAPIQPGNSGGPLFDNNGFLVGITNAGVTSLQNVGYAIKVTYLRNLIEASPEPIDLPNGSQLSGLSLPDKIKRLSPYVVIIKIY